MHTRIQNSEISIQGLQVQYSTFYSNRSNSINSTIRNRLLLQLFVSEMIHAKQWHYSLQRLPVASFYTHSTRRNPRDSSSTNSTYRRQGDLLSSLQKFYKDIPGITTRSSTSSTIQCIQGFHAFQHFFNQNANSTHRLVSTRNSIEYQLGHSTNITFFKEREML